MSILNQFTMVQLTIDSAKMPIPNPKSHITNLQAWPRVPFVLDVPFVLSVRDVSVVRDVRGVSANARCPKKTEHQEMRNAVSEAHASSGSYLRVRNLESRDSKPPTTPSTKAASTPPYQGVELLESGIPESRDSKLDPVSRVSSVSGVSFVSCVSAVSTVSATHGLCKK